MLEAPPTQSLSRRLIDPDGGVLLFLLRLVLLPLTALVYIGVSARNALYDAGLLAPTDVPAPVISVGNLTVGGTGKTPLVIALANRAVRAGRKVAIVARDYGAEADDEGRTDEVALMAARCPQALLVSGPNKLRAAEEAAAQGAEVILVDDGLQHRALRRDLEIVVVDARAPFGNGMVLPGGSLREPAAGIARADAIVLTHGEELRPPEREAVEATVRSYRRSVATVWARHEPIGVRRVTGGPLEDHTLLSGRDVHLFCGLASPEGFRHTVTQLGARVTGLTAFGDHRDFTPADLARVRARARASLLLCTEKDAVKVGRIPGNDDVLCLVIDLVLDGQLPPLPGIDAPWTPRRPAAAADAHGSHDAPHAETGHGGEHAGDAHHAAEHGGH